MFYVFCVGNDGIFASVSPSERLSIQIPLLYLMPGVLFSGLSWPAWYMNEFSQVFSFLLPLRHAAVPMRSLLLEGQAPGLWHSCAWMLTLGTAAFLMGSEIFPSAATEVQRQR